MSERARKNRWWNFSLRTLLVVMTQFAVAFAILPACAARYTEWKRAHQFDSLLDLIFWDYLATDTSDIEDPTDDDTAAVTAEESAQ